MVGQERFELSYSERGDLQSPGFSHSPTDPHSKAHCLRDRSPGFSLPLSMCFTIHRFFVLQEELHPGVRPFVLSYSVTQVLVTCNHFED